MIAFETIHEIEMWGAYDRGVSGTERVALRVTDRVNLGQFHLLLGWRTGPNSITPIDNYCFWPGELVVEPVAWVMIFTGRGTATVSTESATKEPMHSLFWGFPQTILDNHNLIPVLIRTGGILVAPEQSVTIAKSYQPALPFGKPK